MRCLVLRQCLKKLLNAQSHSAAFNRSMKAPSVVERRERRNHCYIKGISECIDFVCIGLTYSAMGDKAREIQSNARIDRDG